MSKPLKYLTNEEIEERASQVLDDHVNGGRKSPELPIDIDTLTECTFRFLVVWEPINDPPKCRTYATLAPTSNNESCVAKLTLNENFRDFLTAHPEIERLTRGHELCHWVIHIDEWVLKNDNLLFDTFEPVIRYHRAQYEDYSLPPEKKNRLAKFAIEDPRAYKLLKPRESDSEANIEPVWMHRQAEHFSACLLVPRHPLYEALENGDDPALYSTHVKLAEKFQVSKRVIQIRLKKLSLIEEIAPGKFQNTNSNRRLNF